jgi:hypothetical protein
MNRPKSSRVAVDRESSNRALCRPSNAPIQRRSAMPLSLFAPLAHFCGKSVFIELVHSWLKSSDFGFRPSDLFLGWTAYVQPPVRESGHE